MYIMHNCTSKWRKGCSIYFQSVGVVGRSMADDTLDTDQPDFCLSLEDNCRISFLVKGLTKTSGPVVKDVLKYMKSLSPFQAESCLKRGSSQASQDILCLRFLSGLPRWLMEGKESQRSPAALTSGGSKRLFGYLGIAHCYDPDDFIEAESNYKNDMHRFSQHLITSKYIYISLSLSLSLSFPILPAPLFSPSFFIVNSFQKGKNHINRI